MRELKTVSRYKVEGSGVKDETGRESHSTGMADDSLPV